MMYGIGLVVRAGALRAKGGALARTASGRLSVGALACALVVAAAVPSWGQTLIETMANETKGQLSYAIEQGAPPALTISAMLFGVAILVALMRAVLRGN